MASEPSAYERPSASIVFARLELVEKCWVCDTPKRFTKPDDLCECDFKYHFCRVRAEFPDEKLSASTVFEITVEPNYEVQGTDNNEIPDSFPVPEDVSRFTFQLKKERSLDNEATIIEPHVATLKSLFGVGALIDALRTKINLNVKLKKPTALDRKEYASDFAAIEMKFHAPWSNCSNKRHDATKASLQQTFLHMLLQVEIEPLFTQSLKKENPHLGKKKR